MTTRIADRWAEFCLSYRKSILVVLAAVTVFAALLLPSARFNNALDIWFLDKDPAMVAYNHLVDTFGSDELIVIGYASPDVFSPPVLEMINRITHKLEKARNVEKVFSLTNIEAIDGVNDELRIHDLIEFPLDPTRLPQIRKRTLSNHLYVGNVVSAEGDYTAIVVRLPHRSDDFQYKIDALSDIRRILDTEDPEYFALAGGPVIDEQFFFLSERDGRNTTVLMIAALVVVLWLLMRSVAGVVLPLLTVVIAVVWAVAWIVLAGRWMNVITTMLPPLLLAVGVADSMHFLIEYQTGLRAGNDKLSSLRTAFRELMGPMFLTSLTTAVGLLSLLVSRVQGVREFGAFGALGVAGAFVLSVSLVPIVASYLPESRWNLGPVAKRPGEAPVLAALHRFTMKHGPAIVTVSAGLVVLGIAGAMRVKAESAFLEYFKPDARIRYDTAEIQKKLSGSITLDVILDSGSEGGINEPQFLRKIVQLQKFLESRDKVSSSQSIADYYRDLRRAFFSNDQKEYRLPETRQEAAQYLLLYEMGAPDGDINEFKTFDNRTTRVNARVDISTSRAATELVKETKAYLAANTKPPISSQVTGIGMLYANMEEYIRSSLVRGFSVALLAIFVIFCLQMRSLTVGTIAMIPNLVPIILCLGVMGYARIRLDSMTAMVASIAIGLAVDDSIHFVSRVQMFLARGEDMVSALKKTTVGVGRALVYTSVSLSAGFASLMTGSFAGTVNFGLLCLLTIVFALIADLLLMPVLLHWYGGHHKTEPLPAAATADSKRVSFTRT